MTDDERLALRAWRYGSYRTVGHRPEVYDPDAYIPICKAQGPGGKFCARVLHLVNGHWRHNAHRGGGRGMKRRRRVTDA